MQRSDPYNDIKQEVDNELLHATQLRADLFAGNSAAVEQLAYQLQNVTEQLSALDLAVKRMVDHPEWFQLDIDTAYARQVEVEKLRWQLEDLQATCAQVETSTRDNRTTTSNLSLSEVEMSPVATSGIHQLTHNNSGGSVGPLRYVKLAQHGNTQVPGSGRTALSDSSNSSSTIRPLSTSNAARSVASGIQQPLPPHTALPGASTSTTRSGWDSADWDLYEDAVQQQMVDQDQTLDHISIHVDRIKQTGQAMHDELEEQSLLLGGLQEETDTSQLRLRGLRRQVQEVIRRSRTNRQFCWMLLLSVILVVITLIAIM